MDGNLVRLALLLFVCRVIRKTEGVNNRKILLENTDIKIKIQSKPLLLTPYIQNGKLKTGRKRSRVRNLFNIESYSGYFTVNSTHNSNLFFWFFPATIRPYKAPVLTWLQGGPSASSLFGLFAENGPFQIAKNNKLIYRRYSWSRRNSVVYIDSPVGTGYSFTNKDGYLNSFQAAAADLYKALTQFFLLFPKYFTNDFYLTGESYAGKYIPALASIITKENKETPRVRINLKGFSIGNPTMDPITDLKFGTFLYSAGLIDENERNHFHHEEKVARKAINEKDYTTASKVIDTLFRGDFTNTTYFTTKTGYTFKYNILFDKAPTEWSYFQDSVVQPHVRREIHVGDNTYHGALVNPEVKIRFRDDISKSALSSFVEVLDSVPRRRVLIYSGHLDIRVPTIGTEEMLRKMRWSGSKLYKSAVKQKWYIKNYLAGYMRKAKNLMFLIIRKSGHIVPYDQPRVMYHLINVFTSGKLNEN